ncbi:hypothetical protein F4775DRAFT_548357 [Biscogniauxia sp. FL1348]|nr:hypothetical protein F4775DRAFT_548357 [Biscogniauxia sp. FL1348]
MAEFDDIEYEGIGADRSVKSVGSERCFRDRSPCDTVISLSDDGKGLYSHPIPLFRESPEQHQNQQAHDQPTLLAFNNGQAAVYEYSAITTEAMESRPTSSGSSSTPLGRYRRDVQAHEQLVVLGETPHQRHLNPKKRPAEVDEGGPRSSSSGHHPKRRQSSILEDLMARDPPSKRDSAAATELAELEKVKDSPAWDDMTVEEQVQLVFKIDRLTKCVKAQDSRRKNKAPRLRTRNPLPVKNDCAE